MSNNRKFAKKKKPTSSFSPSTEAKKQEVIAPSSAKLIEHGRKQSNHIIDTLSKTALTIAGSEGAAEKVAVLERLWAMQKDAEDRQAEREFGIAKVGLAMQLPTIPKRHVIEFIDKNNQKRETPYADRTDIESVLDPICRLHGFSKEYSTDTIDGKACQVLTVRHVAGHKEVFRSPYMPLDTTGSKNNNQAAGSTAEYGKRYALVGAFNIIGVDKDDDGNKGKEGTDHTDKFSQRAAEEAAKSKPPEPEAKPFLSLAEAADLLEQKLMTEPSMERRGQILMKNIKLVSELDDAGERDRAAAIRKLAEGATHA